MPGLADGLPSNVHEFGLDLNKLQRRLGNPLCSGTIRSLRSSRSQNVSKLVDQDVSMGCCVKLPRNRWQFLNVIDDVRNGSWAVQLFDVTILVAECIAKGGLGRC